METLRTVEDIIKEARNDFDLAKASAGREVSMSYWLTETIKERDLAIATALVEALEGEKKKIDVPIGEYGHYAVEGKIEDTLTEAQDIIRTLLETK